MENQERGFSELTQNGTEEEDQDPVVSEIPMFLSKRFQDQLNIFKFLSVGNPKMMELDVRNSFIKSLNQIVKLEVNLDQTSENFSLHRAEEIAQEIESLQSAKKDKKIHFSEKVFDKVDLVSQQIDNFENYIGIYNGSECHIVPVQGLHRFYADFPHLSKSDKWKQSLKRSEVKPDEPVEQQVTVKFSSNITKTDTMNYRKMIAEIEAEPFLKCEWHSENSQLNEWEKAKLFAESKDVVMEDVPTEIREQQLISCISVDNHQKALVLSPNVLSFSSLHGLPLLEQCKKLLQDGKIMTFQDILTTLNDIEALTAQNLLKVLPQIATLVQGNWLVKSEFLFFDDTFSEFHGVPANYLCQARDFVLSLFRKNDYVKANMVSSVISLPDRELQEIFLGVSRKHFGKGWRLRLLRDSEFINKYPNVVEQQNSMWAQREIQLERFFSEKDNLETGKRKTKSISEDSNKAKDSVGTEAKADKRKAPVVSRKRKING